MYLLNAATGLMNTVQQPAGDVAMTVITPKEYYQKTSGLRSFSSSLVTILNPVFATALYAFAGMDIVIYVDLATFAIAFLALLLGVKLSAPEKGEEAGKESFSETVRAGLVCLRENELVLVLILFLGGLIVDQVCEPVMATVSEGGMLVRLFGTGKGSGAALMMFILGILGVMICLGFGRVLRRYTYTEQGTIR